MSHMKRALDVVQDLRKLADSIESLANAACGGSADDTMSPIESTAAIAKAMRCTSTATTAPDTSIPASPTDALAPDVPKLTIVELRSFVSQRSTPETRPRIKDILSRYGVAKLTELSEDKYADIMREVAAL